MPEDIGLRSFQDDLENGGGEVVVWDPVRGTDAKVRRVGKSFVIEPLPDEIYPIECCDAIADWAFRVIREKRRT